MNLHVGNVLTRLVEEGVLANFGNTIAKADRGKLLTHSFGIPRTQRNAGVGRCIEHIVVLIIRHQCAIAADQHFIASHRCNEIIQIGVGILLEVNTLAPFLHSIDVDNFL